MYSSSFSPNSFPADISLLSEKELHELLLAQQQQIAELKELLNNSGQSSMSLTTGVSDVREIQGSVCFQQGKLQFHSWLDTFPHGVFETGLAGELVVANKTALEWFGLSSEDISRKISVFDCLQPEELDRAKSKFGYALVHGRIACGEYQARRKDGVAFPVLISSCVIKAGDVSVGLRGVVFNLSGQKQVDENALVRDMAFRSSLGAIGLADMEGEIIYVNDAFVQQWGYKCEDEILGKSVYDFVISKVRMKAIIESIKKGAIYEGEEEARKVDGTPFEVRMSAYVVFNQENVPICIMTSFLDISEQQVSHQKLCESEKWINATFDDMIEGYQIIDMQWYYRYLNKSAIRYSKRSAGELIGHKITEVYSGIEHTRLFQYLLSCMNNRSSECFEEEFVYPDGAKGWFEFHIEPHKEGISILTMDISARKESELKLAISEERYRILFETSSLGILYLNNNGEIVSANASAEIILGRASEQLIGHITSDMNWNPIREDGTIFPFGEEPVNVSLRTGRDCSAIMGIFNEVLGKYVWVKVNSFVKSLHVSDCEQVVCVTFEDITHLKEVIADLERSNEVLNSLREIDHVISHATLTENFVNEIVLSRLFQMIPCEKIEIARFDFERNEAVIESQIKEHVFEQNVGVKLPIHIFNFDKLKRGEHVIIPIEPDKKEIHAQRHQGLSEILSIPLRIDGELVGVLALFSDKVNYFTEEYIQIANDISAQLAINIKQLDLMLKQKAYTENLEAIVAERTKELQETLTFQQTILDNAGVGIISISTDGIIQSFNPTAEQITGYSAAEVIGVHTPMFFTDKNEYCASTGFDKTIIENQECNISDLVESALKRDMPSISELDYITKNKTHVPVLLNTTTLKDSEGNVKGAVGFVLDISKRKEAEDALRKNEERFSRMFYEHEAVMLLINPISGKIVNANKAAERFYGYNFSDQECNIDEINVLPKEVIVAERKKAIENKHNYFVFPHRMVDGEVRTVEVYSSPIEVDGYKLLFSIIHDVTERKEAEDKLVESEAINRAIIGGVPDFMFRYNREGYCLESYVNNESGLYISKDRFLGEKVTDVLPEKQGRRLLQAIVSAFESHSLVSYEYSYLHNGKVRYFENRLIAISESEALSILREITDRKEAELQLLRSEELNQAIINALPDTLFRFDRDGTYLMCHTSNPDVLVVPESEFMGRRISEILPPEDAEQVMQAIGEALDSKRIVTVEYPLQLPHGRFYFEDRFVAINDREVLTIGRDITDRKEAELSLQWNESLLQMMACSSPLAFFVVDNRTDEILYFNHRFCEIWSVPDLEEQMRNKELKNSDIISYCIPLIKDVPAFTASCVPLQDMNNRIVVEDLISFIDGRTIRRYSTQLRGAEDQYFGRFYIFEDVTEKIKEELQLRMQTTAFETFALAVIITDKEGVIEWANPAYTKLTGFTNEEVIGRKGWFVKSGKHDMQFYKELWTAISSGKVWNGEFINRHKDGYLYFEENTITPVKDDNGEIARYIAMKVDVTARKEMEVALRLSEQRWQFVLEGVGDGVWDWNLQAGTMFFSHQFKAMLGYDDSDLKGFASEWAERVHPEDLTSTYEKIERHLNGQVDVYTVELRMLCKDGTYKWILCRGKLLERTENGNPLRMIGTHTDISEIKKLEERLRLSIEQGKELNDMKSRFVSIASHEFRTPLASILLASESLSNYWPRMNTEQISDKLLKIKSQTQHLGSVVNDVMQLSRMQEGKIAFQPEMVNLTAMCQEIAEEFNHPTENATQRVYLHFPQEKVDIYADRRLMRQILNNLISNAIKYSPLNPKVEVTLRVGDFGCQVRVMDNGLGIPLEDQKHLFTPFFRASNVGAIQGNGLGLNIIRESVLMHGGDITFESKLGLGTVFIVSLPKERIGN